MECSDLEYKLQQIPGELGQRGENIIWNISSLHASHNFLVGRRGVGFAAFITRRKLFPLKGKWRM